MIVIRQADVSSHPNKDDCKKNNSYHHFIPASLTTKTASSFKKEEAIQRELESTDQKRDGGP